MRGHGQRASTSDAIRLRVDEPTFAAKNLELRDRVAKLTLEMEAADRRKDERADLAVKVFELSQDLRRKWFTAGSPKSDAC